MLCPFSHDTVVLKICSHASVSSSLSCHPPVVLGRCLLFCVNCTFIWPSPNELTNCTDPTNERARWLWVDVAHFRSIHRSAENPVCALAEDEMLDTVS